MEVKIEGLFLFLYFIIIKRKLIQEKRKKSIIWEKEMKKEEK
jgi:hypothetical protein